MAKLLTLEQVAKVTVWFLLSTFLLFAGPRFAERFLFNPSVGSGTHYLGVAISVLSLVPWFAYVAWGLSIADEYNRRTLIVGTAFAFALAILFSIATQLMADARLTNEVVTLNLPIGFVLWSVGVGATWAWFRVRRGG